MTSWLSITMLWCRTTAEDRTESKRVDGVIHFTGTGSRGASGKAAESTIYDQLELLFRSQTTERTFYLRDYSTPAAKKDTLSPPQTSYPSLSLSDTLTHSHTLQKMHHNAATTSCGEPCHPVSCFTRCARFHLHF